MDTQKKVLDAVASDKVVKAAIEHAAGPDVMAVEREAAVATELETSKRTESQRNINRTWEDTQMRLAILTVGTFVLAHLFVVVTIALVLVLRWDTLSDNPAAIAVLVAILTASLGAIASTASLVIGFYFGRTNHTRTGGVGGEYVISAR